MKISKMLQIAVATCLLSSTALADSVNLSGWSSAGGGSWQLQAGNDSVKQTINTPTPAIFYNGQDSQGLALSGEITVQTTSDDDFVGFVLGYNDGDLSNGLADYILIDWKQTSQAYSPFGGTGDIGLSISRVSGALDTTSAWIHSNSVTELQRAENLGSTGWGDNTTYSFDLIFTASLIEVKVNGITELSIGGLFNNGSFGFYNFSQGNVLYAGIEENIVPAVPVPAALFMFAPVLLGFMGFRRRAKT